MPDKFFEEILDFTIPDVEGMTPKGKPIEVFKPYTIQIKRKNGEYYVHFIYEENEYGRELYSTDIIKKNVIAGIDINIDRIAVSLASNQGNFLESKVFYCHELEYVRANKKGNLVGETVKTIFEWLKLKNAGAIVIENLTLKQQHDTNKKFNRLTHNFKKKKLMDTIIRRALREGFLIKKVNPAYTSVIGRFKYSEKYGLSVHEAASFVIARRGLGFEEKVPKALLLELKKKVKPYLIARLGSMEESEKHSEQGKKQRQYIGMLLNNINNFKNIHLWSLWNVVHKTL
ncbi:IS200/IS605 family accessory protein TnpB-related protein [Metabacillus sp. Hm71]|uniref:IS200/IS605 family accessory protein TnpB-related protein n=1 Tax=Metabacillus sp. Hm71 TaxID=3450743 RepID=UPI003F43B4A4